MFNGLEMLQINENLCERPPKVFPSNKEAGWRRLESFSTTSSRSFRSSSRGLLPLLLALGSQWGKKEAIFLLFLSLLGDADNVCAEHCFTKEKRMETVVSGEDDPSPFSSYFHDGIIPTLTPFRAQIELPNCSPSGSSSSRLQFPRACVCLQKSYCNSLVWQGKAALLQKDASLCYVHCISRFFKPPAQLLLHY